MPNSLSYQGVLTPGSLTKRTLNMSIKYSHTTADYLNWDVAMNLIRKLFKDGNYRMSLLIGCGCFFGLRVSDLLALKWNMILGVDSFALTEKKTGKRRVIKINEGFKCHILDCYRALRITDPEESCYITKYGTVISTQMINRKLKGIKTAYRLPISNISTHTLRKTFSRKVWENENAAGRGEQSLVVLSEMLNHSSVAITRRYIGLREQEIGEVYDALQF